MKTLDDQVPSGYFDALPNKTLARLEGKDMQSTSGTTREHEPEAAAPPPGVKEDSGLHDIRSLAQSTKQRMANKRVSTSPVRTDDDVLAASSAGWVALPEPAKMVSLPAIDQLPSKQEVRAEMKASKAASAAVDLPVTERPAFGANLTARKKSSKAPVAIAGVLLAAAAGVGIFVYTQNQAKDSAPAVAKAETAQGAAVAAAPTPAPAPVKAAEPAPPPPPPEPAVADNAAAGSAAAEPVEVAKADPVPTKSGGKHVATKSKPTGKMSKSGSVEDTKTETTKPVEDKKVEPPKKGGGGSADGEPSFDALLKEAGVDQTKKPDKPKLEKKELSRSDFNAGMSSVKNAAQACYKGTQGTAMFKMNVAPSGQVTSVTVTGQFAGKPEASCVESAVKNAHFPPWDGNPQSFTYSYLLAE
jgi:hypothetical protein